MLASVSLTAVTDTDTDAAAIAASLAQPRAFGAVFERHFDAIHRFLRARVGAGLGEELASETFVRAFAARARYDGAFEDARPWLFAIATNLVRAHRRAEARRLRAYAQLDAREAQAPPDEETSTRRLDAAARGPAVGRALAALREAERDALLLVAWGDLTYEETARALDVPIGTVRSRLHRARAEVRGALGEEER
jgi:RNA polymerase sigma-70 factor (ECF subfamily)